MLCRQNSIKMIRSNSRRPHRVRALTRLASLPPCEAGPSPSLWMFGRVDGMGVAGGPPPHVRYQLTASARIMRPIATRMSHPPSQQQGELAHFATC